MDQLKPFLQACVKYRFWIAVGISVILPIVGFFLGYDAINAETLKREKEITGAKTEVGKYTGGGLVNHQYQPLAAAKKDALVQDVDATWRRLFAIQEPLLKWPAEVQDRFRKWGRKYPEGVDKVQVTSTLIDYAVVYPEFVDKIYQVFKPFNFDDGSGIVVAPEARVLLAPATFSQDNPPDLSKVWSEQERLWVVTALLDAVAKVNDSVGAKDWDGAIVKQINLLEVGAATDQDQKSIAKGVQLQPADVLAPGGAAAPPPPPPSTPGAPGTPGMPGMMDSGSGGAGGKNVEVLYLKTDSPQFKALPIKLTVLVDQARLANYLVGLENSPMAIQVNEVEISKPLQPVAKPAYGERASFNLGSMGGRGGRNSDEAMMMGGGGGSAMARAMGGSNNRGPGPGSSNEMMMRMGGGGSGGPAPSAKKGIDVRNSNAAEKRKQQQKKDAEAAKAKSDTKKIDQYYNIIEVTVYGEARFYLSPPAPPQSSTASNSPTPEPQPPAAEPAKKDEAAPAQGAEPKAETAAPKEEAPKKDEAPKDEAPKGEAPKPEAPKPDASKGESPAPKS